jgi:hypothetical protein
MKHIVVTAADEAYEDLLFGLIDSLVPHLGALKLSIGCLDIGLSPAARTRLATLPVTMVTPAWPFRPHPRFDEKPTYLSRAVRPFLPDLFPGFETYVWMDADTWLQQVEGLKWLIGASAYADLVGIPTVHRTYKFQPHDLSWLMKRYEMAFGPETARQLMQQSYLNSGVFAAPARSRLWKLFASRFQAALENWNGEFLSDQAVINGVAQLDGLRCEKLPAQANWICHLSLPVWDGGRQVFCVPAMPFEPLMIVHNTFTAKNKVHTVRSLTSRSVQTPLTFPAYRTLRDSALRATA